MGVTELGMVDFHIALGHQLEVVGIQRGNWPGICDPCEGNHGKGHEILVEAVQIGDENEVGLAVGKNQAFQAWAGYE